MSQKRQGYDERPDPGKPGQQGKLFRNEAPARAPKTERGPAEYDTDSERIPSVLYHGTVYHGQSLGSGDKIRPGFAQNATSIGDFGIDREGRTTSANLSHVYSTPYLGEAHKYANRARDAQGGGTPVIYQVQAQGKVEKDPEYGASGDYDGDFPAYRSSHASVISKLQFPKAHELELEDYPSGMDYHSDGWDDDYDSDHASFGPPDSGPSFKVTKSVKGQDKLF